MVLKISFMITWRTNQDPSTDVTASTMDWPSTDKTSHGNTMVIWWMIMVSCCRTTRNLLNPFICRNQKGKSITVSKTQKAVVTMKAIRATSWAFSLRLRLSWMEATKRKASLHVFFYKILVYKIMRLVFRQKFKNMLRSCSGSFWGKKTVRYGIFTVILWKLYWNDIFSIKYWMHYLNHM